MNFWDQNFSVSGYKYGTLPNVFMAGQAFRLKATCDVLVPGDGEGRNGVWLAQQGHRVTAVDSSQVGLDKARALAHERGVQITTVHADLDNWIPEPNSADVLVLIYVHLPAAIRSKIHQHLLEALRPNGYVIVEAFHPKQLGHTSGGPKDPSMLYTLEQLRSDFAGLEELLAYEGTTELNEGPGHRGIAHVTQWVAQRAIQ